MAKSRLLSGVSGQFQSVNFGVDGTITTRSFADSGIESVTIDNTNGDHVSVNAFSMNRTRVSGGFIGGSYINGNPPSGRKTLSSFPADYYNSRRKAMPATPAIPNGLPTKLYAQASPDKPQVLLPVFIAELREVPRLIRDLGLMNIFKSTNIRRASQGQKTAAAMWLSGNFGWAPLLSDLKKLVTFADSVARREKEMDKLYSQNGLRRRVSLFEETGGPHSVTLNVSSAASFGNNYATGNPTVKVWGVVRYKPVVLPDGSPLKRPTPRELRRRILGLNAASITLNIWEALPWSWMIDYFVNIGDFLQANPLGRTAVPFGGCIMTHRFWQGLVPEIHGPYDQNFNRFTCGKAEIYTETKERVIAVSSPTPTVLMNPLSGHQLSILGSLAVLKARRLKP